MSILEKRIRMAGKVIRLNSSRLLRKTDREKKRGTKMSREDFMTASNQSGCSLDLDLKYVFFSHNKNAQTSINRVLLSQRSVVRKDNESFWSYVRQCQMHMWNDVQPLCFTIVRNPYTRALSAFNYLQLRGKIDADLPFRTFVVETLKNSGPEFDPHFEVQSKYHKPITEMGFDQIVRFEHLDAGWRSIAANIDAPLCLPKANSSRSQIGTEYCSEAKRIVLDIYARDFVELAYDPDQIELIEQDRKLSSML